MLKVHLTNGQTLSFELRDDAQKAEWGELSSKNSFQEQITGMALLHNKTLYTLPLPKKFRQRKFDAQLLTTNNGKLLGELLICQVDNIRLTITAYYTNTPKMVKFDVVKTGFQRHTGV